MGRGPIGTDFNLHHSVSGSTRCMSDESNCCCRNAVVASSVLVGSIAVTLPANYQITKSPIRAGPFPLHNSSSIDSFFSLTASSNHHKCIVKQLDGSGYDCPQVAGGAASFFLPARDMQNNKK